MKNIMQQLYRISVVFLGKTCYVYNMSQKRWQEFLLQLTPSCAKSVQCAIHYAETCKIAMKGF